MARDIFHDIVKRSLEKEGWRITHDPLRLSALDEAKLEADLGSTKMFGAELGQKHIAVEVKGFRRPSLIYEFHAAYGQYLIYEDAIERRGLEWEIYLAIPEVAFHFLEKQEHVLYSIRKRNVRFILFDENLEIIKLWIK